MIATMEKQKRNNTETVFLDPDQKSPRAQEFEEKLSARIVGQERAVRRMSGLYQIFLAGMNPMNRPVGTMLFLGPTGSGKTRVVEAAAEVLFGDPNAVIKIDCAEFQHSHEIAKLIGSPPGYLGHRETSPMLTQETLARPLRRDREGVRQFVATALGHPRQSDADLGRQPPRRFLEGHGDYDLEPWRA
jgi:ATP-dependent Clp protease ATP-binding subunit ClpA